MNDRIIQEKTEGRNLIMFGNKFGHLNGYIPRKGGIHSAEFNCSCVLHWLPFVAISNQNAHQILGRHRTLYRKPI